LNRIHRYQYGPNGKLLEETTPDASRTYTYEPRGFLTKATQSTSSHSSFVERSYDPDGHLASESIYLDSRLIQHTEQIWTPSSRILQINGHARELTYQNRQLTQVSSGSVQLLYDYDLSGRFKRQTHSALAATWHYNQSGLPETIQTRLPDHFYEETLFWYPSGKLFAYTSPQKNKQYTYTKRGQIQTANEKTYEFDFGLSKTGVRTAAPESSIPEEGLDAFGRVILEKINSYLLETSYDPMGQLALRGDRQFAWDPWGRLIKITANTFVWEATYDPFGRRLETSYTSNSQTLKTTSFYDPEEEFREIGMSQGDQTFWKLYGPKSCDAVLDTSGNAVYLIHNALGELEATISSEGLQFIQASISPYGPESPPTIPLDLLSYATSLNWHSLSQDPTGLIWMGARYYDPLSGRFLSPDPVSYPLSLDLYAYADGDPVNYLDPDGRFSSPVYQSTPFQQILMGASTSIINKTINWMTDRGWTSSSRFTEEGSSIPNFGLGWINGIQNTFSESRLGAKYISQLAGGLQVSGVYNAMTNVTKSPLYGLAGGLFSFAGDILKCAASQLKMHLPPARLVQTQWFEFFLQNGPKSVFLQVCHSGGGGHVKNALLATPEWIRKKIIVVAIAPSAIIPKKLCLESYNYISRRDVVTYLDMEGRAKYSNELRVLEPHPKASFWDHEFLSPTFEEPIEYHIRDSIRRFGGKK